MGSTDAQRLETPPDHDQLDSPKAHISSDVGNQYGSSSLTEGKLHSLNNEQASAWHKQSQPYKIPKSKHRGKRKAESLPAALSQWIVDHQIGFAVNLLVLLALTHLCFPRARRHTRKFFQLSYYNPGSGKYTLGWDDLPLVFYWIVVFTGLRAAVMDYILEPLAFMAGIEKKKEKVRFAEQAWIFLYSSSFWSLGMYLMYNSKYWLNLRHLWTDWPTRELDGLFKWYYLVQFAFWLQQMVVVNIEERRSDYAQMFAHHVVTSALIFTSYGYHHGRVGNMIMCLMDIVDILLPLAKMMKYMQFQLICDITFGLFIVVWFVTRHVFYLFVLWSLHADAPQIIKYGCYWGPTQNLGGPIEPPDRFGHLLQPFLNPVGLVCWNGKIADSFMVTLLALQVILLLWFVMIIQVAIKVIRGGEAEDSRSDDEESSEEEADPYQSAKSHTNGSVESLPYEKEVGVEGLDLCISYRRTSPQRKFRRGGGAASGVTIPSDRKELLGRIGCDKKGS
ncbi:MAG: hypothetical protein Q9191_004749 [Dirinaria sp. TL-2023a]